MIVISPNCLLSICTYMSQRVLRLYTSKPELPICMSKSVCPLSAASCFCLMVPLTTQSPRLAYFTSSSSPLPLLLFLLFSSLLPHLLFFLSFSSSFILLLLLFYFLLHFFSLQKDWA